MTDIKSFAKNNKATNYVRDSLHELTKVTWPTKNQAVRLTIIVLSVCLIFAVALTAMDFVFGQGHNYLVKWSANFVTQESSSSSETPINIPVNAGSVQATTADGNVVDLPITTSSTPVELPKK